MQAAGIRLVLDMRNPWEAAAHPEPSLPGMHCKRIAQQAPGKPKDQARRFAPGTIGEYGAPGERMCKMYRRFAHHYEPYAQALQTIAAAAPASALFHCVNGKDRTGILSALILRIAGATRKQAYTDYLLTNETNAQMNASDLACYGKGMDKTELAILASFFEARTEYLDAYFDELDNSFGGFEPFVADQLSLAPAQKQAITAMLV
jgi:protein-tyrosine phosphatase